MKCIGGLLDGKDVPMRPGAMDYTFAEREPLSPFAAGTALINATATAYTRHIYTKRKVHLSGEREPLEFLAPEDWNDARAIRYQFSK